MYKACGVNSAEDYSFDSEREHWKGLEIFIFLFYSRWFVQTHNLFSA